MKINWNYIKGIFLIIGVLFLFGFSNYRNKHEKITNIDVQFENGDNLFMSYEMVNKLLIQNGRSVKNKAKSLINLNTLEKQVLSHPMVESVTTFLTIDGELKTRIKQRTPIGRVHSGSRVYYMDCLGEEMPLSENYSARVPLVTGVFRGDSVADIFALLSFIRADEFLNKQIVGVRKEKDKEYKLMTRVGLHEIELGTVENMHLKFKKLKAFYNFAIAEGSINKYKKINLKYNNQVVCTKK